MGFTDKAKSDAKLQARIVAIVDDVKENGLPKTREGLKEMDDVYHLVYGQRKKPTNCIYCRRSVADYLEKAVFILEIEPKKKATAKKATAKAPAKPKKRTATKKTTAKKATAKKATGKK